MCVQVCATIAVGGLEGSRSANGRKIQRMLLVWLLNMPVVAAASAALLAVTVFTPSIFALREMNASGQAIRACLLAVANCTGNSSLYEQVRPSYSG